jgi:hypothetical protein
MKLLKKFIKNNIRFICLFLLGFIIIINKLCYSKITNLIEGVEQGVIEQGSATTTPQPNPPPLAEPSAEAPAASPPLDVSATPQPNPPPSAAAAAATGPDTSNLNASKIEEYKTRMNNSLEPIKTIMNEIDNETNAFKLQVIQPAITYVRDAISNEYSDLTGDLRQMLDITRSLFENNRNEGFSYI